jgi:sirohydrochlorin ferrochelatase
LRLNLRPIPAPALALSAVCLLGATARSQTPTQPVPPTHPSTGVLLLAHGGATAWNARVADVARDVSSTYPTEVAFGMASRAAIAAAVKRLRDRDVSEVVAVPLFVSSHSSVVTSTEYLLGLRADPPADLALFARMSHGGHDEAVVAGQVPTEAHAAHVAPDPTSPIDVGLPLRMAPAFNRHPIVGEIVADRARGISREPSSEALLLVAHGPVPEDDNRRWLADMAVLADIVRTRVPFAAVDVITVRDDASPAVRQAATEELRAMVRRHHDAGRRVLVVPHLMSFGGIEQGIRTRLDGLAYTMSPQALLPDPRAADWVRSSVAAMTTR